MSAKRATAVIYRRSSAGSKATPGVVLPGSRAQAHALPHQNI